MTQEFNRPEEAHEPVLAAPAGGTGGLATAASTEPTENDPERARPLPKILNRDPEDLEDSGDIEELVAMYNESMKNLEEGEILKGRIIRVDEKEVLVDIGFKSEGVIPIEEFSDLDSIKVGDDIDVFLEKIKGGFVVDLFGVEAFLPGSQVALRPSQSVDGLMNDTLNFKIIKLNKRRRNIVVSRRLVLEEERAWAKTNILKELEVGQIREGFVKNITDFGAFVDLGGIDGLLHITDMSWGRIRHPSEVVNVGDKIQVKVLSFDPERERISLGLKQLTEYPWERVDEKYPAGFKVNGKVVSLTDYGAFVELEKGVEGLIHVSEMSWTKHVRHPSKILEEGQRVDCMVLKVDKENEKISLGLKQVEPDPWLTLDDMYPINAVVEGKVRNLTNFGAFVELEEGIDGLVHISDMSWTRRVGHPSEVVKKGQDVKVRVLAIDKVARRISLGLKQVDDDPWPQLIDSYAVGAEAKVKVAKATEKGLVVMVADEIEGFIPTAHLGIEKIKDPAEHFDEGDELDAKVTRVDSVNHRILLSIKAFFDEREQEALEEFVQKHARKGRTVGEALGVETPGEDPQEGGGPSPDEEPSVSGLDVEAPIPEGGEAPADADPEDPEKAAS
jgi:small subunit ribosomal protein S1